MGDRVGDPEAQAPLLANIHDDEGAASLAETGSPKASPDTEVQEGVQQADAVTLVWTRSALILAYAFIFLNFCLTSMEQQTTANLLPFVVSDFSAHSLIPAIGIASFILSGVLRLPVAKIIDTWGRPQGLAAMVFIATVGLAMMAGCSSAATYAAAQILHAVGFSGFTYILDIIVADTSSLQDRTLAFAFAGSPAIVTNFLGPPAAQWFLHYSSWRTAFALFTVLIPLVAFPVFAILQVNTNRAKKLGILKPSKNKRTWREAIWHYSIEFDGRSQILHISNTSLTKCSCWRLAFGCRLDPVPPAFLNCWVSREQVVSISNFHAGARNHLDRCFCLLRALLGPQALRAISPAVFP